MGGIVDAIGDAISAVVDATVTVFKFVWDNIVVAPLEYVFAVFGIEDETVVEVTKISTKLLEEDKDNTVKATFSRVAYGMRNYGDGFFRNYMREFYQVKGRLQAYYNMVDRGQYAYDLPESVISGLNLDEDAVVSAIVADTGVSADFRTADAAYMTAEVWTKNTLQSSPYLYRPSVNTLTFTDTVNGGTYSDWEYISETYNPSTNKYDISIGRDAIQCSYWVDSPSSVTVSGSPVDIQVELSRPVPTGQSLTVNINYTGGVNGTDYTGPTSIVFAAGETQKTISLTTVARTLPSLLVEIELVPDNSGNVFEIISPFAGLNKYSLVLTSATEPTLTVAPSLIVEATAVLSVPVVYTGPNTVAFTADLSTSDGTAVAPDDYTSTNETLVFSGVSGQIVNMSVPIESDLFDESEETFNVDIASCSLPSVDISSSSKVRIVDNNNASNQPDTATIRRTISVSNYPTDRYLVATYFAAPSATEWFYWIYRLSDNTYPDIDPSSSTISNLEMLPIAVLRKDRQNIDQDPNAPGADPFWTEDFGKDSEVYTTSRKLLNFITLGVDDLIESLNSNADIDSVADAYINFSMNPLDVNPSLSKLLWLQYYEIIVVQGVISSQNEYTATFKQGDIENALMWGEHSHTANISTSSASSLHPHSAAKILSTPVDKYTHTIDGSNLHIFHKTSSSRYSAISINGINSFAAVKYGAYHQMSASTLGNEDFNIPVSWFIAKKLKVQELVEVYPYLIRFDIYAVTIQELEWYETEAFRVVFQIVLVVVTIISLGSAAPAGASALATLGAIATQLAINYAIGQLIIFVAEETGNAELAAIVGIVAVIVLGDVGAIPPFDLGTMEGLGTAVSTFADTVGAAEGAVVEGLQDDLNDLVAQYDDKLELYKAAEPQDPLMDGATLATLKSPDTSVYLSSGAQYDYDQLYNYDRLLGGYIESLLYTGQT